MSENYKETIIENYEETTPELRQIPSEKDAQLEYQDKSQNINLRRQVAIYVLWGVPIYIALILCIIVLFAYLNLCSSDNNNIHFMVFTSLILSATASLFLLGAIVKGVFSKEEKQEKRRRN